MPSLAQLHMLVTGMLSTVRNIDSDHNSRIYSTVNQCYQKGFAINTALKIPTQQSSTHSYENAQHCGPTKHSCFKKPQAVTVHHCSW